MPSTIRTAPPTAMPRRAQFFPEVTNPTMSPRPAPEPQVSQCQHVGPICLTVEPPLRLEEGNLSVLLRVGRDARTELPQATAPRRRSRTLVPSALGLGDGEGHLPRVEAVWLLGHREDRPRLRDELGQRRIIHVL